MELLPLYFIGVGRGEGGGGRASCNNLTGGGGGQHTLWPPNNPPTFSLQFLCETGKNHKCTKLKGKIIINVTLI